MKTKLHIPIFDATLWVVVSNDIMRSRKAMRGVLGDCDEFCCEALCSYRDNHVALFFKRGEVKLKYVSHEVFHATLRILEWTESVYDAGHHEPAALLNAYLMDRVMETLKEEMG